LKKPRKPTCRAAWGKPPYRRVCTLDDGHPPPHRSKQRGMATVEWASGDELRQEPEGSRR
jgi:hypothetical protein